MTRIYIYGIIVIVVFGVLTGTYYSWRKSIERQALLEFNQKQLEQTLADQAEFRRKMQEIAEKQEEIIKRNAEDRKAFEDKINAAQSFIESEEARKNDRPASDLLKETVKRLKDSQT
jgi:predicted Holliday junction resolvase-like endonuclease